MVQTTLTVVDWEERRASEREALSAFSTVRNPREGRHSVIVEDVSATGFRFRAKAALEIGDIVQIDLPRISGKQAKIIWGNDGFYGCHFLDEKNMKQGFGSEEAGEEAPHKPYSGVIGGSEKLPRERKLPGWARIGLFVATCGLIWYGIAKAIF